MSGFSGVDGLDDFARRVKRLTREVVTEHREEVEWEMLPVSSNDPDPTIAVDVCGEKRNLKIGQKMAMRGVTDEEIKGELRGQLQLILQG
jgi:hypothetical protein